MTALCIHKHPSSARCVVYCYLMISSISFVGCGNSLPATVRGTITIDGQALPDDDLVNGSVTFHPLTGGAAAMSSIAPGGTYEIKTGTTKGLNPGDYRVTVRVVEMEPPPPGGYQNAPGQKRLTAARFEDRERSELQYSVKQGRNQIDLELQSK